MSHSASRAANRSAMRSGGWDKSASITTSRSKRQSRMPSITERDRSRGGWRRVTMRTGRRWASSATTASLPSSELSSTSSSSQAILVLERAASMRSARRGMLAASRKVGTMMETAWRGLGFSASFGSRGVLSIPVLGNWQDSLMQRVNHILQGDRFPHSFPPPGSAGVSPATTRERGRLARIHPGTRASRPHLYFANSLASAAASFQGVPNPPL